MWNNDAQYLNVIGVKLTTEVLHLYTKNEYFILYNVHNNC